MAGVTTIATSKNNITSLVLKNVAVSEECVKKLKEIKLKAPKTLNIILSDDEVLAITECEPEKVEKPKNVRKLGINR